VRSIRGLIRELKNLVATDVANGALSGGCSTSGS